MRQISEAVGEIDVIASLELQSGEKKAAGYGVNDHEFNLERLFENLFAEFTMKHPGYGAMMFAQLTRLLILLSRKRSMVEEYTLGSNDPIGQCIDYMRRHASEKLTVQYMAGICMMSERHFFRLFKERSGQTFHDCLQHIRVQASCQLLAFTPDKIALIAETVGYRDTQSFTNVFKRIVGLTPGVYRKRRAIQLLRKSFTDA